MKPKGKTLDKNPKFTVDDVIFVVRIIYIYIKKKVYVYVHENTEGTVDYMDGITGVGWID